MSTDYHIVDAARKVYLVLWDSCNEYGCTSYFRYKFFKYLGEFCEDYEDPEKVRAYGSAALDIGKSELQPFDAGAGEAAE